MLHIDEKSMVTQNCSSSASISPVSSQRTVPVTLSSGSQNIRINALLEDGSTLSYVNRNVAAALGLKGLKETLNVQVLNGRSEVIDSEHVSVELADTEGRF